MAKTIVTQNTKISVSRGEYLQRGKLAANEGAKRELITNDGQDLDWKAVKNYLSGGAEIKDGDLFECVISLEKKDFLKLGEDTPQRKKNLHDAVIKTYQKLFASLGYENVNFASSIHLNTDNPHIHTIISSNCQDKLSGSPVVLNALPRKLILRERKGNSVLGNYFEEEIQNFAIAVEPQHIRTLFGDEKNLTVPNPEPPYTALYRKVYDYLTKEKNISEAAINNLRNNNSFYINTQGASVYVRRNPVGKLTGYANQNGYGNDSGDGFFYIGNPRESAKFILTSTPLEALSVYELTRHRDLSDVCIISCDGKVPSPAITNFIKDRNAHEPMRVIWSLGLDHQNQAETTALEEFQTEILSARSETSPRLEIINWNPNPRFGKTWNRQLVYQKAAHNFRALREQVLEIKSQLEQPELSPEKEASLNQERENRAAELYSRLTVKVEGHEFILVEKNNPKNEIVRYDWTFNESNIFTPKIYRNVILEEPPTFAEELDLISYFDLQYRNEIKVEQDRENPAENTSQFEESERNAGASREINNRAHQSLADKALINLVNNKTASLELRQISLDKVLLQLGLTAEKDKGKTVWRDSEKRFEVLFDKSRNAGRGDDWYDRINQKPGTGAIDLVSFVLDKEFRESKIWMLENFGQEIEVFQSELDKFLDDENKREPEEKESFRLYQRADENLQKVKDYLSNERGLSLKLIESEIAKGNLYADRAGRAVFVYRSPETEITGGWWRATDSYKRNLMHNSNFEKGWYVLGELKNAARVVLCEDPIEAASYFELQKIQGKTESLAVVGLAGTRIPEGLLEYLSNNNPLCELNVAFSDKKAAAKAYEKIEIALEKSSAETAEEIRRFTFGGELIREKSVLEDWNQEILTIRQLSAIENDQEHLLEVYENAQAEDALDDRNVRRLPRLGDVQRTIVPGEREFVFPVKKLSSATTGNEPVFTDASFNEYVAQIDAALKELAALPPEETIIIDEDKFVDNLGQLASEAPQTYSYFKDKIEEVGFDFVPTSAIESQLLEANREKNIERETIALAEEISEILKYETDSENLRLKTVFADDKTSGLVEIALKKSTDKKALATISRTADDGFELNIGEKNFTGENLNEMIGQVIAAASLETTINRALNRLETETQEIPQKAQPTGATRLNFRPRPVSLNDLDNNSSKDRRRREYEKRNELHQFAAEVLNEIKNPAIPVEILDGKIDELAAAFRYFDIQTDNPLKYAEDNLVFKVAEKAVEITRPNPRKIKGSENKEISEEADAEIKFTLMNHRQGIGGTEVFVAAPNFTLYQEKISELINLSSSPAEYHVQKNEEDMPSGFIFSTAEKALEFINQTNGMRLDLRASAAENARLIIAGLSDDYREAVAEISRLAESKSYQTAQGSGDFYESNEYYFIAEYLEERKAEYERINDAGNDNGELSQTIAADAAELDENRSQQSEIRQSENLSVVAEERSRITELSDRESGRSGRGNEINAGEANELADGKGNRRTKPALTLSEFEESLKSAFRQRNIAFDLHLEEYSEDISKTPFVDFALVNSQNQIEYILQQHNGVWQAEWINNYENPPSYLLLAGNQPNLTAFVEVIAENSFSIVKREEMLAQLATDKFQIVSPGIFTLAEAKDVLTEKFEAELKSQPSIDDREGEDEYLALYAADGETRYLVYEPFEDGYWLLAKEERQPATKDAPEEWIELESLYYEHFDELADYVITAEKNIAENETALIESEILLDDNYATFSDAALSDETAEFINPEKEEAVSFAEPAEQNQEAIEPDAEINADRVIAPPAEQFGRTEKRVAKLLSSLKLENEFRKNYGFYAILENSPYMPLHVTFDGEILRLTYWYEQNGDLMHDGEINFAVGETGLLKFKQSGVGIYGVPKYSPDRSYAEMFSKNLIAQGYEEAEVLNSDRESYFGEAAEKPTLKQAVNLLLGVCDGATSWDGHGFNKLDTGYARHLGEKENWNRRDAENAHRMLKKYKGQLASYGIRYKELAKDVENYLATEPLNNQKSITVIGDNFNVAFPYNPRLVEEIKKIPGAKFQNDERGKYWSIPITGESIEKLQQFNLDHDFTLAEKSAELLNSPSGNLDQEANPAEEMPAAVQETVKAYSPAEIAALSAERIAYIEEGFDELQKEAAANFEFHSIASDGVNEIFTVKFNNRKIGHIFYANDSFEAELFGKREKFIHTNTGLTRFLLIYSEASVNDLYAELNSYTAEILNEHFDAEGKFQIRAESVADGNGQFFDNAVRLSLENDAGPEEIGIVSENLERSEEDPVTYYLWQKQDGSTNYVLRGDEFTFRELTDALKETARKLEATRQTEAQSPELKNENKERKLYQANVYLQDKLETKLDTDDLYYYQTEIIANGNGHFPNNSLRVSLETENDIKEYAVISENLNSAKDATPTYSLWRPEILSDGSNKYTLQSDSFSFEMLVENVFRLPESKSPLIESPEIESVVKPAGETVETSQIPPVTRSEFEEGVSNLRIVNDELYDGSDKARFQRNVRAIELLKQLEDENRYPQSEEERLILGQFSGFGSMKAAFELSENSKWENERKTLAALLTEEEYASAFNSTKNAHYTSPEIAKTMWNIASRLGFNGGRVIEPSAGSGVFLGTVPDQLLKQTEITAVELDSLTGRIAEKLYPNYEVKITGYENHKVPANWYDLAIGNVPFGDYRVFDPTYNHLKASIHDYFAIKGLDQIREGGLQIIITSSFTMDKIDSRYRERMLREGKLIGALRLPSGVFERSAGTEVLTDVLIFQKHTLEEKNSQIRIQEVYDLARTKNELAQSDVAKHETRLYNAREAGKHEKAVQLHRELMQLREIAAQTEADHLVAKAHYEGLLPAWLKTVDIQAPDKTGLSQKVKINQYFAENPAMVLGEIGSDNSMYSGEPQISVKTPEDFNQRLQTAIAALPRNIYQVRNLERSEDLLRNAIEDTAVKVGAVRIENDRVIRAVKNEFGFMYFVEDTKVTASQRKRIARMLELRDIAVSLRNADFLGKEESRRSELRGELNLQYDRFIRDFGALNLSKNTGLLKNDPDAYLLKALENYDKATGKVEKTDFFKKPTVQGYSRPVSAASVEDALAISLNEYGKINFARMTELLTTDIRDANQTGEFIIEEFQAKNLAYINPVDEHWLPANEYLAGDVKEKLRHAQTASQLNQEKFSRNVEALTEIIPADIAFDEIDIQLGAPYLQPDEIRGFLVHLTGGSAEDFLVNFAPQNGMWTVSYTKQAHSIYESKAQTNEIWGTTRMNMMEIVQHALDGQRIRITDREEVSGKVSYVLNAEATEAANAKLSDISDEFESWVWADQTRRISLTRRYNDLYNCTVPMKYDGSYLTFPGLTKELDGMPFELYPFQKDVIDRMIKEGNGLIAHEVGLGKTYEMIIAAMKMKQMGKVKTPVIAVKKSTIEEISHKAQSCYPNARILSFDGSFDKDKRNLLMNRLSTNDYDLVVMTHDQLDRLPMRPEVLARHINEELAELQSVITEVDETTDTRTSAGRRLVSKLLSAKNNLITSLRESLETNKDDSIYFEETGIDSLFIDEFQRYKSLPIYTKHAEIKGVPNTRSRRAVNMLVRADWLREQNNGQGFYGFTGTPITNSPAELYNLQKFFQRKALVAKYISHFDAWLRIYARTVTKLEKTATGEYKQVTRLAKYANLPELIGMTGEFMDIKRAKGRVEIVRPEAQQIVVDLPMSDAQRAFIRHLQIRAANLDDPRVDNMLAISTDARKCSLDLRLVGRENENLSEDGDIVKVPNKADETVKRLLEMRNQYENSTQLVFSDLGVHDVFFHDIIEQLKEQGVPANKIINFSDLSESQRKIAQKRMQSGDAWFGLGSTETLGTGVNVQKHLIAVHHDDVPWLPSSVEQRDGRILRNGNRWAELDEKVKIYRYVTVGAFDELMWQTVDRKQKFITSIMNAEGDPSKIKNRTFEDRDAEEFSYEEIAAIASGNPLMLQKVELDQRVGELQRAEARFKQSRRRMIVEYDSLLQQTEHTRDLVKSLESDKIIYSQANEQLGGNLADARQATAALKESFRDWKTEMKEKRENGAVKEDEYMSELAIRFQAIQDAEAQETPFEVELTGKTYTNRAEAGKMLSMLEATNTDKLKKVGVYKGFDIILSKAATSFFDDKVALKSPNGVEYELSYSSEEGVWRSADAKLGSIDERIERIQKNGGLLFDSIKKLEIEKDKKFKYEDEFVQKSRELDIIDFHLSVYTLAADEKAMEISRYVAEKYGAEYIPEEFKSADDLPIAENEPVAVQINNLILDSIDTRLDNLKTKGNEIFNSIREMVGENDGAEDSLDEGILAEFVEGEKLNTEFYQKALLLRGKPLAEYWYMIDAKVSGDGEIEVSPAAYEFLHRNYREKIGFEQLQSKEFGGVFNEPPVVKQWLTALEASAMENPDYAETIGKVSSAIEQATDHGQKWLKIIADTDSREHENMHVGSFLARGGQTIEAGHARFEELATSPVLRKADLLLTTEIGQVPTAVKIEELAARCGVVDENGNRKAAKYDLTVADEKEFLRLYFSSIAEKNGIETIEQFKEIANESAQIRDEIYERVTNSATIESKPQIVTESGKYGGNPRPVISEISSQRESGFVDRTRIAGEEINQPSPADIIPAQIQQEIEAQSNGSFFDFAEVADTPELIDLKLKACERQFTELTFNSLDKTHTVQLFGEGEVTTSLRELAVRKASLAENADAPATNRETRRIERIENIINTSQKIAVDEVVREMNRLQSLREEREDKTPDFTLRDFDKQYHESNYARAFGKVLIGEQKVLETKYQLEKSENSIYFHKNSIPGEENQISLKDLDFRLRLETAQRVAQASADGTIQKFAEENNLTAKAAEFRFREKQKAEIALDQTELREKLATANAAYLAEVKIKHEEAETELKESRLDLAGKSQTVAEPAKINPHIDPEVIWRYQSKALRRGDAESFERLESVREQGMSPRSNYAVAQLKGASYMAKLEAQLLEERIEKIRQRDALENERVEITFTTENGKPQVKKLSLVEATEKVDSTREKAENTRQSRDYHLNEAVRSAYLPINSMVNPFSPVQGTLGWITSPNETLRNHLDPMTALRNDPGVQLIRGTFELSENIYLAVKKNSLARELEREADFYAKDAPAQILDKLAESQAKAEQQLATAQKVAEVADKSLAQEEKLRDALKTVYQTPELEMPCKELTAYEIEKIGKASVELKDGELLGKYQKAMANPAIQTAVGETLEDVAKRTVLAQAEASVASRYALENLSLGVNGELTLNCSLKELETAQKAIQFADQTAALQQKYAPEVQPDFTDADFQQKLDKLIPEMDGLSGLELAKIYRPQEELPGVTELAQNLLEVQKEGARQSAMMQELSKADLLRSEMLPPTYAGINQISVSSADYATLQPLGTGNVLASPVNQINTLENESSLNLTKRAGETLGEKLEVAEKEAAALKALEIEKVVEAEEEMELLELG